MKRFLKCVPLVLLLLLSGCVDLHVNVRPEANADERWVSTDPPIFFTGWDEETGGQTGEILLDDGSVVPIQVLFDYGIGVHIFRLPRTSCDAPIIRGDCRFSKNKLTVTIVEDTEQLLGDVEKLTLIREGPETGNPYEEAFMAALVVAFVIAGLVATVSVFLSFKRIFTAIQRQETTEGYYKKLVIGFAVMVSAYAGVGIIADPSPAGAIRAGMNALGVALAGGWAIWLLRRNDKKRTLPQDDTAEHDAGKSEQETEINK